VGDFIRIGEVQNAFGIALPAVSCPVVEGRVDGEGPAGGSVSRFWLSPCCRSLPATRSFPDVGSKLAPAWRGSGRVGDAPTSAALAVTASNWYRAPKVTPNSCPSLGRKAMAARCSFGCRPETATSLTVPGEALSNFNR